MSIQRNRYTLTNRTLRQILGHRNKDKDTRHDKITYEIKCSRCNKELIVNTEIVSKNAGLNKTKHYHKKCYEEMYY